MIKTVKKSTHRPRTIEPFTLCRFNYDEYRKTGYDSPFLPKDRVLFLGEIRHMQGHCAVVNCTTGKVEIGWHTDQFTEIPEDEV